MNLPSFLSNFTRHKRRHQHKAIISEQTAVNQEVYHIPALLGQSIEALDIKANGIYVDATFGGGGHSRAILEHLSTSGHLYAFDQDEDAIKGALDDSRFTMVYGNFRFLTNFLRYYGVDGVDGILADLGVSFHHFDDAERGFSFRTDGRLDMRMNQHARTTAADVLNNYSAEQLADIFYLYGEFKQSRRIADTIISARQNHPIETVGQLLEICSKFINPRKEKKDLACIFQALRIEVNGELEALRSFLEQTVKVLKPNGRLAILTYHSLEDRLVKNFMRYGNFSGTPDKDFFGRINSPLSVITSKPIVADENEVARNPRSRSAKLRVAQKI